MILNESCGPVMNIYLEKNDLLSTYIKITLIKKIVKQTKCGENRKGEIGKHFHVYFDLENVMKKMLI